MQSQNLSAIIYDSKPVSSCLGFAAYKKQVEKLKWVEAASLFFIKNEYGFPI